MKKVIEYILEEANIQETNWEKTMESRLELLLHTSNKCLTVVLETLVKNIPADKKAQYMFLIFYMSIPNIGVNASKASIVHHVETAFSRSFASSVDEISHILLSALTATSRQNNWSRKSQDLEICARKLTATHSNLVIRQLPILAGSLRGRAQYDWSIFKSRGHFVLFGQVLGLIELLKPQIYKHKDTLCNIIDSYFLLLKFHGNRQELTVLTTRLVAFLQSWMVKDIQNALKYLQQHGMLLK